MDGKGYGQPQPGSYPMPQPGYPQQQAYPPPYEQHSGPMPVPQQDFHHHHHHMAPPPHQQTIIQQQRELSYLILFENIFYLNI